ncbi:Olfactory receptor 1F12, partial [Plecturocebus cupreus]
MCRHTQLIFLYFESRQVFAMLARLVSNSQPQVICLPLPPKVLETPSLLKIQKISQTWWYVPVIPPTRKAEAGESCEPNRQRLQLGAVAHTYNPSTLGGRGGWITRSRDRDHPGQHRETLSLLKIQKWWRMPVVPATREAEAEELLKPRRQRLQSLKIIPIPLGTVAHACNPSTLGGRGRPFERTAAYPRQPLCFVYTEEMKFTPKVRVFSGPSERELSVSSASSVEPAFHVVVTRIEMPGQERKKFCKQVCWREGVGRGEEEAIESILGFKPTHFPSSSPPGEPKGWTRARKELKFDLGFC